MCRITDSFGVYWYCNTQMNCFMQNKKRVVHLDATGNVVQQMGEKRTFYYAMVYRSELSSEVVQIFELLSSKHNVSSLSSYLRDFRNDICEYLGQKSPIKTIVVDFSFALMNAVSLAFNDCNLAMYLDFVYDCTVGGQKTKHEFVYIASCYVHVMKFMTSQISKNLLRLQRKYSKVTSY